MEKQKTCIVVSCDSFTCPHFSFCDSPSLLSLSRSLCASATMHRQSLGSPSSKLHIHGGAKEDTLTLTPQEPKRHMGLEDEDDNKSHRLSVSPSPRPDKFIHVIPILTLLCFFILYLFSHNPTQSDLAQFNGFKRLPKHFGSAAEMNDIQQYMKVERGNVLAIRSQRNLQEIGKQSPKSRPHRKFADF